MGIFMITINQISSHTIVEVYPRPPRSTCHGGLQLGVYELPPRPVVLRDLEGCSGLFRRDPACGRDPHREARERLVDLDVPVPCDADPVRAHNRLDEGVGQRYPPAVAAVDVEPRIEDATPVALAEHGATPRRGSLARGVDATIAGVDPGAGSEGEALAIDADAFDDECIRVHRRAVAGKEAVIDPRPQGRTASSAGDREHAASNRPKLPSGGAVQQALRAVAPATADRHEQEEQSGAALQPVQPQRATAPYDESPR